MQFATTWRPTCDLGADKVSTAFLKRRTAELSVVIRNVVSLFVGVAVLLGPERDDSAHVAVAVAVVGWACVRIVTRSRGNVATTIDVGWAVALCLAWPLVDPGAALAATGTAQAVTGVTVATLAIQLAPKHSVPVTFLMVSVYAVTASRVVGWVELMRLDDVYGLLAACAAGLLMRAMIAATAALVDTAYLGRVSTQIAVDVADATRHCRQERLSTLHDTAAATLILVTGVDEPPRERLAVRAAHDLAALSAPVAVCSGRVELVGLMRAGLGRHHPPVRFAGRPTSWLDGRVAVAVNAAATEVLNNVERHADADQVVIDVQDDRITISDNGIGFVPEGVRSGWGVRESIVARMARVGGRATLSSALGAGTIVTLSWSNQATPVHGRLAVLETDRAIGLIRAAFGLAAAGYAATQVVIAAPAAVKTAEHGLLEAMLVAVVLLCAAANLPGITSGRWGAANVAAAVLALVALAQPLLLVTADMDTGAWTQSAIGLCLIPLVVRWPFPRAAAVLLAFWLIPTLVDLLKTPVPHQNWTALVGPASWLVIQLGMCAFGPLSRRAAHVARVDHQTTMRIASEERVRAALTVEYTRHHSDTVGRLVPLLSALRDGVPITTELRRTARTELRHLRELFDCGIADVGAAEHRVRSAMDRAEARGVDVTGHVDFGNDAHGTRAERLTATVEMALDDAVDFARVVIASVDDVLTASVVHGTADTDGAGSDRHGPEVDVISIDATRWVSVRIDGAGVPG